MALTVGTDTYIDVSGADTYWNNHRDEDSVWADATTPEKEAALREATQYIDKNYSWIGEHPGSTAQLLAWPRNGAVDSEGRSRTGIPQEVKDATAYVARQALQQYLKGPKSRGGATKSISAASVDIEYFDWAPRETTYQYVDMLLKHLTTNMKTTSRLIRT